jgi:hypothetical protein
MQHYDAWSGSAVTDCLRLLQVDCHSTFTRIHYRFTIAMDPWILCGVLQEVQRLKHNVFKAYALGVAPISDADAARIWLEGKPSLHCKQNGADKNTDDIIPTAYCLTYIVRNAGPEPLIATAMSFHGNKTV